MFSGDVLEEVERVSDAYPSRGGRTARLMERQDPVVYARNEQESPIDFALIERYRKQGFLVLENMFSDKEVDCFRQELDRLRSDNEIRAMAETVTESGNGEIRSIFKIHENSPLFRNLASDRRMAGLAQYLLDDRVYIHQSRVNYKPGFRGKEFYWHSDFETWHVEDGMPRMRAVSISIALTDNYAYNGPLMLVPGSQDYYVVCEGNTPDRHYKMSLKQQEYGVPSDALLRELVQQGGIVPATGKAGSVIIFDCNVMHGSGSNITPYPRSNVFFVYNALSNAVGEPFGHLPPRPDYLCTRERIRPIAPQIYQYRNS